MNHVTKLFFATAALLVSVSTIHALDQTQSQTQTKTYTQPANVTQDVTKEKKAGGWSDEEITQKVRWAIRDDKELSSGAKNAQIIVKDGNVTVSGSVKNEDEKTRIATIIRQIQGVKSVSNNLNIYNR